MDYREDSGYKEIDEYNHGEEYLACKLTEAGETWILENQDKLEFKVKQKNTNDDIPF